MLLLVDANVLIDYAQTEPDVLALVAAHLGTLYVAAEVLAEVDDLDEDDCERLGLEIVEGDAGQLVEAASRRGRLSFEDHLCLILARDRGLTCVTNDTALRSCCADEGIAVLWGLELLLRLIAEEQLTADAAIAIAQAIRATNPRHITAAIVTRFERKARKIEGDSA